MTQIASFPTAHGDGAASPFVSRLAIERLRAHLDETGALCEGHDCTVCESPLTSNEVGRLRTAQLEYRTHVEVLGKRMRDALCMYCGDVPSDRDHLLPRTWTGDALRPHVPTVAACRSCNGILSTFPNPLIAARCEHIGIRLRRTWGKQLSRTPDLEGLSGNLRRQIAANGFRRGVVRGRLVVLDLGGVPALPDPWRELLMADGPAALSSCEPCSEEIHFRARRPTRSRWSSHSPVITGKANSPKLKPTPVDALSKVKTVSPGAAYMQRKAASS